MRNIQKRFVSVIMLAATPETAQAEETKEAEATEPAADAITLVMAEVNASFTSLYLHKP